MLSNPTYPKLIDRPALILVAERTLHPFNILVASIIGETGTVQLTFALLSNGPDMTRYTKSLAVRSVVCIKVPNLSTSRRCHPKLVHVA